jgi:DUF1680 family protein
MRIPLLACGLAAAALSIVGLRAGEQSLVDTVHSPGARMYMANLSDARWTHGLWADRFEVCRTTMIPHMWEIFQSEKESHAWANYLLAAGMEQDVVDRRHEGPPFADGDFLKWFEAVAQTYALTREPALDQLMDRVIAVVAKAQRADGYLYTEDMISRREGGPGTEFGDPDQFETYNMGHLMTAACIHYRATGKTTLLALAQKAADYLAEVERRSPATLARNAICPSHYMGAVELYRATGDPRYRDLTLHLVDGRTEGGKGTDQNQDRLPFRSMTTAIGHAVRANYLYAGVADLAAETQDATLERPLAAIADDVASHKLYLTGATGALYDGASPDGSADHKSIQLVAQAYGRDFQLPNLTAYNEGCATVGMVLWDWRMLVLTGDASYADRLEQSLYNGVLAGINLAGDKYFYVNPLRKLASEDNLDLRWSRERQPNIKSSFCCPPNLVRTIAEAQDYIYSLAKDTLWVNLYGASTLDTRWVDGGRIRVHQETDYPWSGRIRLVIDEAPERPIALRLRIPGWSAPGDATVRVGGRPAVGTPQPGTYFEVKRTWKGGDGIELDLRLHPELVEANAKVEETLGQVAVRYGPIVYCLESNDLPAGVRLLDVALSPDARQDGFVPRRVRLGGAEMLVLDGTALQLHRGGGDPGALYHELDPRPPMPVRISLVPYYAWDNRGDTEMSVWLPLR